MPNLQSPRRTYYSTAAETLKPIPQRGKSNPVFRFAVVQHRAFV